MTIRFFALVLAACILAVGWAASCVIWRAAEVGELVAPLETRTFHRLTFVAVGTGGSYENPVRLGPVSAKHVGSGVPCEGYGPRISFAIRAGTSRRYFGFSISVAEADRRFASPTSAS